MKTIIWKGPEREIPGYGMGTKGAELTVPDAMAYSYIEQGLAELKKAVKKVGEKEEAK